ncbi:MAG: AAA family ATPase, partial [Lachnospiraceae bacterium]|nr:AAA family ATPase [Lachnospiraceae bacterium]
MENHMKRNAQKSIENWFLNNERKHLYITGMRGTGKTTLIRDFLEKNAGNRVLYLNFETD